mmetsp:Transcript_14694/g.21704  ORF Transcript_14694/g.21704 Transcript_14694/m.21704 type:complete len:83 (+) Transcript_14694:75-323(+)
MQINRRLRAYGRHGNAGNFTAAGIGRNKKRALKDSDWQQNVPAHQYHPCHHSIYPEQRHTDWILSPQLIVRPIFGQGHAVHP